MEKGLGAEQDKRTARAMVEGPLMEWRKAPDGSWIVETPSGGCYKVHHNACSCEDFRRNCSGTLMRCKHVVALNHRLLAEAKPDPVSEPAPKAAKAQGMTAEEAVRWDALYR